MDLSELQDLETVDVPIKNAKGEDIIGADGKPWTIKVAGPSHPATFRAQDILSTSVRRFAGDVAAAANKEAPGPQETDEDVRLRMLAPLIERTLGWSPVVFDGKPFPFSRENSIAIYTTSALIRGQVEIALYTDANFRKRPLKP